MELAVTTPAKLESAFVDTGATGDTVRKSIAFMLAFAKDAGVELSPHLKEKWFAGFERLMSARKD